MKKTWKKCLAVLVSLCLIFCVTGVSAFAEETDAAKIGETPYATLDEAIANAADGDVIVLLKDCTTEGINLSKNLTIQGSGNETVTFTKYGIALWGKALTFKDCKIVMNAIGSTPYTAEWSWMTICASKDASLTLNHVEMLMDGDPEATGTNMDKHAIYFCSNNKLNLENGTTLTVRNYKQDALEWDGSDGGYNVNITNSTFISDHNRSGFTGTFVAKITNSNVDVINSLGNGSNSSHFEILDASNVNFNDNGAHGLSAASLKIWNSTVNANGNGANGIHVAGALDIDQKSVVTIEKNKCSISSKWTIPGALYIAGQSRISDSTVTIQGNSGSGIYQKSGSLTVEPSATLTIVKNTAEKLGLGGGVYVNGTMKLAENTVLYNNHAATAGDDIYNLGEISFGKVGSDWALDGAPDCEHAIDGWYDDAENNRWNAHAEKDEELHVEEFDVNGEAAASALKAAHGVIYYTVTVNYYDKATGEKIAESFVSDPARENTAYDVTAKDKIAIDGYEYDSTTGDLLTGTLDGNKTINVYYSETEVIIDSSVPQGGPSSSEEEIEDSSVPTASAPLPATGSTAVLPIAVGMVLLSALCAVIVVMKKRQSGSEE